MCATVLWTVNHAGYTPAFREWTKERLGVEPASSHLRIEAPEFIGKTAGCFTLPLNMCNCDSAVGYGEDRLRPGLPAAPDYVEWLQGLPVHSRFTARVTVVRTWNPEEAIVPAGIKRVDSAALAAETILRLSEENLLVIDFPRPPAGEPAGDLAPTDRRLRAVA